jgi:hypothetical protein
MKRLSMGALSLAFIATSAHADGAYISPTNDRVRVSLGAMDVISSTTFRVDSSTGTPGTYVDAENQLGLDKSDIEPKFQFMVRAGERNRLRFDYFTLDRTGDATLSAPIVFRDSVLQIGDPVQTTLNLRVLGITYGYSFWHSEKLEIAATLGVDSVDISARARVTTATRHVDQREDQAGPYPTPGIDATWVVSKRFYFDGRIQYLDLHFNGTDGSLGFLEFDALYRFRPNVSFALGYNAVKAHLSSTQSSQSGFYDFKANGPEAFIRVAF